MWYWITAAVILLIALWISWEIHIAPTMPDDYDLEEDEAKYYEELKNAK
jgi:hypothetical protein